jgi:hypothetical protein
MSEQGYPEPAKPMSGPLQIPTALDALEQQVDRLTELSRRFDDRLRPLTLEAEEKSDMLEVPSSSSVTIAMTIDSYRKRMSESITYLESILDRLQI